MRMCSGKSCHAARYSFSDAARAPYATARVTLRFVRGPDTPLTYVKGVGPGRAACSRQRVSHGGRPPRYLPLRYEDRSNLKPIAQLAPGEMATVIAEVRTARVAAFKRRNLGLFEATFGDGSGATLHGKWFHGGYLPTCSCPGFASRCSEKSSSTATPAS